MNLINDKSFNNFIKNYDYKNIKEIDKRNDYYKSFN